MSIRRTITIDDIQPNEVERMIWEMGSDEQACLLVHMGQRAFKNPVDRNSEYKMRMQLSWVRGNIDQMDEEEKAIAKKFVEMLHEYICEEEGEKNV